MRKRNEVIKISEILKSPTTFEIALGTFLDNFRNSTNDVDKYNLICDPVEYQECQKKECAILASIAHKLANDNHLKVPEWVRDECFILPEPIYSFDTKHDEFKQYLSEVAPIEFKLHNVFYTTNILGRA